MKKIISFLFLLTASLFSFSNAFAALPDILALVNDHPITKYEFESRRDLIIKLNNIDVSDPIIKKRINDDSLNLLIEEELLGQYAEKINAPIDDEDINEAIASIERKNNMPKGGMKKYLHSLGVSSDSFRNQIKSELIKQNIVGSLSSTISVAPGEIDLAMVNNYKNYNVEAWVFTSHADSDIARKKMQQLRKRLSNCDKVEEKLYADFADAERFDRKLVDLPEYTQSVVLDTKVGNKSSIFKQNDKLKMVFVCKKENGISDKDLNNVKSFISNHKMSRKFMKFFKDLKTRSDIKIMMPGF